MSRRRQTAGNNRVRGPNSALTDFLAANRISAAEIRSTYEQRQAQARQEVEDEAAAEDEEAAEENAAVDPVQDDAEETPRTTRARAARGSSPKQIEKIKKSKAFQRRKAMMKSDGGDSDSEYEDDLVRDMYKKSQPPPGQLENCEMCNKRFTVTPYSKSGQDGGLVCTPCGKELATQAGPSKKAKKAATTRKRRKVESDRLEANYKAQGAKTLQQLCIEKVAAHHNEIEEFGDVQESILIRLSEIFSKKRVLDPRTLKLFLRDDLDGIAVHDAAYLESDDYDQIFATAPHIEKVVFRNACQFKDKNMRFMLDKAKNLRKLQLYASNLISDTMWAELFKEVGLKLQELKLQWLDASFDDETVETMVRSCPNIFRLKLKLCRRIGSGAIDSIARLTELKHLSLQIGKDIESEGLVNLITSVGKGLETLSLEKFFEAGDTVLQAIHDECYNLRKLRFSENDLCSDAAFYGLFTNWTNPPLRFVDLNSARDIDNSNPGGPEEPIGLASNGFKALMEHSGSKLGHLNIASCRHISHATFIEVFDGQKIYPELQKIDISFCNTVDTVVVAGILKSCPKLDRLVSFGNFKVEDVVVPAGVTLIGVPKAQEAIEQVGEAWMGLNDALNAMPVEVGA
ncbi:DNA repair protein Rad7, protein [Saccharata proteae CBS 121410]|uniref:DNA repair protein Rad7, protein n=1 Tax=Saccharata proteae CBS 121410 TaxID=1314787 RepID=A0A9P4HZA4_9PEZI|nr:DNA repair protein Rad7, protein [Saccharata proteae CBS 121410]